MQEEADYYVELRALQRRWRVQSRPRALVVDLSYHTTGSVYPVNGEFLVRKRVGRMLSLYSSSAYY